MQPTPEMIEAAARTLYYQEEYADLGQIRSASWDELSQTNRNIFVKRIRLPLQAALSAIWQPIETAPKDGTCILAWAERHGWEGNPRMVCVAWDKSGTGRWCIYGAAPTSFSEQWLDTVIPMKWTPLPQPPETNT